MTEYAYRDAGTGEYVTEQYAKEHPETTVREERTEDTPDVPEQPAEPAPEE